MARRPLGRAEIAAVMSEHGIHPSRALGQNFVIDPNVGERIARLARVGPGDRVIEIGAGFGSLTLALAGTGASVVAVEVDKYIEPVLRSLVEPAGVRVVLADAMHCDYDTLLQDSGSDSGSGSGPQPWVLVANLPYNIATPLVANLLVSVPAISRMLVMVQKEAGERLAAAPGSGSYGGVSVRVAYFAEAQVVGKVAADVFLPRPKVESVLVGIVRRSSPAVDPSVASFAEIDRLVRAGFAGRRKMLRRSLSGIVSPEAFEAAGVQPTSRPEELGVAAWGKLAECQRLSETRMAAQPWTDR